MTAQVTLLGVPAATETVPAANVFVADVSVAPKRALVAPIVRTPAAPTDEANAIATVMSLIIFVFIEFPTDLRTRTPGL